MTGPTPPAPAGPVDLLVIGGGITGAGIARDAALRGISVVLLERGDFAEGTSSRTSKLVHGGLRYLEHGQLSLVMEACRERATLLRLAPHLVRPLEFLVPFYAGDVRPAWKLRAGLVAYDLLARGRRILPHRVVTRAELLAMEPGLRPEGLYGGAVYADCQMQDARLCLAVVLDAERHGAVCRNGARVERLMQEGPRVTGAVVRDQRTGREERVYARVLVNAAGPWADHLMQMVEPGAAPRLRPTRGAHVVLPRAIGSRALLLSTRADGRVFFILPWGAHMLVGTTEAVVTGVPNDVHAEAGEVAYLVREAGRVLAGTSVTESAVIATFAGLRPLVDRGPGDPTAVPRGHLIVEAPRGMFHVLGGKYTTHRAIAEQVVARVLARLGRPDPGCRTAQVPLWRGETGPDDYAERVVRQAGAATRMPEASLRHLAVTYGERHQDIVALAAADPALAQPLCAHHPHLGAELVYACRREHARGLVDFGFRRTARAFSPCHGEDGLAACREMLIRSLGWSEEAARQEVAAYAAALAAGRAWRGA